jgi:predicted Zn-dependent peptidase
MQQESTIARSSSIARDWYHLGRVMTLAEVRDQIDALTVTSVLDYVRRHPAQDFTILTIGPQPLEEPRAVS